MAVCISCKKEFDEKIAYGICPFCGASQDVVDDEDETENDPRCLRKGTILNGRYEIIKVLGAGGFGVTYKALDKTTGGLKAVKEYFQLGVVNRNPGTTEIVITAPKRREEFEYGRDRLINEAKIVAKFQSPGIVRVDDYFLENNTSYMVMEYINSQTLEDYLMSKRRLLTIEETVDLGVRIAEALEEIHAAGVVHRDIAPDNLFVDDQGEVKIIDFGSARLSKEDTDDRLIVLKPGFAPPEQYEKIDAKNDRQKQWTDVYALGATLYLCLTGVVPPESSDRKSDKDAGTDRLAEPNTINENIPEWLNNTIMTAMALNTHERFKNATELKEALLQKRKVLPVEKVRKRKRLRRTTGIIASLLVVALVVTFGVRSYINKRNKAVLDPANITIWYALNADEEMSSQKTDRMNEIVGVIKESDRFADVEINIEGIPETEYLSRIEQANTDGNLPNLFEYPGEDGEYISKLYKVDSLVSDKKNDCYLLSDYKSVYSDSVKVPLGFNIPIIYINTALAPDYDESMTVTSFEDLTKLCEGNLIYSPIGIDKDLYNDYTEMFGDFKDYESSLILQDSIDGFLEGSETAIYLGSTADYYTVRMRLAGMYAMEPLETNTRLCRFINEWCIKDSEQNENEAAREILAFLLENNAQDRIYLQSTLPGLPLDKTTLEVYPTVRPAFSEFVSDDKISKFKPSAK